MFKKFNKIILHALQTLILFLFSVSCSSDITGKLIDDRDNQEYRTVIIGNQRWMAENLRYLPHVNPPDSDSGIYVYGYFGNTIEEARQTENYEMYGALYNWATAMDLPNKFNAETWHGSDSLRKGICPEGWHLPSDTEWIILETYLESVFDTASLGQHIKSDTLWKNNGNGTDKTGFSALPAGFRYREGLFDKITRYGYFWTATQLEDYGDHSAGYRYLIYSDNKIHRSYPSKKNGFSVRCIKN